jgi:hypothetical protein
MGGKYLSCPEATEKVKALLASDDEQSPKLPARIAEKMPAELIALGEKNEDLHRILQRAVENETHLVGDQAFIKVLSARDFIMDVEGLSKEAKKQAHGTIETLKGAHDTIKEEFDNFAKQTAALHKLRASFEGLLDSRLATVEYTAPIELQDTLDQGRFITHYVSPVAGLMWLPGGDISSTYLGIQITAYDNPINAPMWTRGKDDLRRMIAFELGLVPEAGTPLIGNNGSFGDARLSGPMNWIPYPIMTGISFQVFPYVSASGGALVYGTRTSTLELEKVQFKVGPYFALSAQLNIFDLITQLFRKPEEAD